MTRSRIGAQRSGHEEGGLVWQCMDVPFERSALVFAEGLAVVVEERVWGVVCSFWGEHDGIDSLSACDAGVARSVSLGATPSNIFGRKAAIALCFLSAAGLLSNETRRPYTLRLP